MRSFYAFFFLVGALGSCSTPPPPITVEEKLSKNLACKGLSLYYPQAYSIPPYKETVSEKQLDDDWEETEATLLYHTSINRGIHLYTLAYDAEKIVPVPKNEDSKKDGPQDDEDTDNSDDTKEEEAQDTQEDNPVPIVERGDVKKEEEKEEEPKESDEESEEEETTQEVRHITHFLKSRIPLPMHQIVRIRYCKRAPLIFEWTNRIDICQKKKVVKKIF